MAHFRLHAFTLIELTIALLLVAILSGIAYSIFNTFNGHTQQRQRQKQERYSLDLLLSRLKTDCAQSDSIAYTDRGLYFADSLGQIEYKFEDAFIIRKQYQLRSDTFDIQSEIPLVQFVEKKSTRTGLVRQIDLNLYFKEKTVPVHLQKVYSSEQIINALTQP